MTSFTKFILQKGRRGAHQPVAGITGSLICENYRFALIQECKLRPFQECVCVWSRGEGVLPQARYQGEISWFSAGVGGEQSRSPKAGSFRKAILKSRSITHLNKLRAFVHKKQRSKQKQAPCPARGIRHWQSLSWDFTFLGKHRHTALSYYGGDNCLLFWWVWGHQPTHYGQKHFQ